MFNKIKLQYLLVIIGLIIPFSIYAIDKERVLREMNLQGVPEADAREYYLTGCDTGLYMPMVICARFGYVASDLELNDIYKQVEMNIKNAHLKINLRKEQRAWLKLRDLTCKTQTDEEYEDSRFWHIYNFSCLESITNERNGQLKKYLECDYPCN